MTERDDHRVRKALQGADFPAAKPELLRYADERGTDEKTLEALRGVPDQQFGSLDEVAEAVPQEPEGEDAPGGSAR